MSLKYASVCSGIEAPTVAWEKSLNWHAQWFSEIEPFPCELLSHYYPNVPNLGNMLYLKNNPIYNESTIDLLVGGTPCQDFSVAGLRAGLAGERGNLTLEFCRILIQKRPRWFVWENVPGALSSYSDDPEQKDAETSDFAQILAGFSECGYSCAWRVLDAQFFGVPQRRRRIFVVGYIGDDWRPPAAVLFEPGSLSRNHKKGRKKGQDTAGTLDARVRGGGFPGSDGAMNGHVQPMAFQSSQSGVRMDEVHATLDKNNGSRRHNGIFYFEPVLWSIMPQNSGKDYKARNVEVTQPLMRGCGSFKGNQGDDIIQEGIRVRRLTPLECERLQGFPDEYTNIPGASDTARYQSLGNSMAVPVMHWIGKRIDIVDKYFNNEQENKPPVLA